MMSKKERKESKLISKCIKAPIRVLSKARDFYMRTLLGCAGKVNSYGPYDGAMGYPTGPYLTTLPRSFSAASSSSDSNYDNDLRELIRIASARGNTVKKVEGMVPRSKSVHINIGRIDEEKACEFGGEEEDIKLKKIDNLFPRSRSYAVPKRRVSWATNNSTLMKSENQ